MTVSAIITSVPIIVTNFNTNYYFIINYYYFQVIRFNIEFKRQYDIVITYSSANLYYASAILYI